MQSNWKKENELKKIKSELFALDREIAISIDKTQTEEQVKENQENVAVATEKPKSQ